MITDQQRASIEDLAKRFDWSSEETEKTIATLSEANQRDAASRSIALSAAAHDWSPAEERAIRDLVLGKDASRARPASWAGKEAAPAASHADDQAQRIEASTQQWRNR